MRIAMWSGPRNLSTTMMYAFASRSDFAAWDEPFYAPYLAGSGEEHPMLDTILARHESDPRTVAEMCLGPIPGARNHFYMKHMPHHMLDDFPLEWAKACVNVHLIRHPKRVIASYAQKRNTPTVADLGFHQQLSIFQKLGGIVVDSEDIRQDPETALSILCEKIDLPFDGSMLTWEAGPKAFDGAWAPHWYNSIHSSTGFAGPEGPMPDVESRFEHILEDVMPSYQTLFDEKTDLR